MGNYPDLFEGIEMYADFLNGDISDITGRNTLTNNGTAATTDRFGNTDSARLMTVNDYIDTGISTNDGNGITWLASVYPTGGGGVETVIERGMGYYFILRMNQSSKITVAYYTTGWNILTGTTTRSTNTWYNVGLTYDGTTIRLYVNGVQENSVTATVTDPSQSVYIGDSGTNTMLGKIGEVMLFNSVKTAGEMKALNDLMSQKYIYPYDKTLPSWWKENCTLLLNGSNDGTTRHDQSGNGNDGTETGTITSGRIGLHNTIVFDGSSYLTLPTLSSVLGKNNTFSIAVWIKATNNVPSSNSSIVMRTIGASDRGGMQLVTTGDIRCGIYNGSTWVGMKYYSLSDTERHFLVYTFNTTGTVGTIYIDGIDSGTTTASGVGTSTAISYKIGASTAATYRWNGDMSLPMIYSYLLSPTQIQEIYYKTYVPNV